MGNLSDSIKKLVEINKTASQKNLPQSETEVIIVDEVAARVASFYERIRGIVDWREEHVLRKTAIERVLKRRMLFKKGLLLESDGEDASEQFLKELVRGGHFPNGTIPISKIEETRNVINKYVFILEKGLVSGGKDKAKLENWFMQMASYEIEITLDPHEKEIGLIMFMTEDLLGRIKLREEDEKIIGEDELKLQVHVAVHRALFKMDDAVVSYHLFERLYRDWHTPSEPTLLHVAAHILEVRDVITRTLKHPLAENFYKAAERYDTPYLILGDVISKNPQGFEEVAEVPDKLDVKINEAYKARLARLKGRIRRAAFYSTVSIFLTKVLTVLALELPIDKYLQGSFNYTAISVSVLVPPLLMVFLINTVKVTSNDNFEKVKGEVKALISGGERSAHYVALPKRQRFFAKAFFKLFYLASFLLSFGLILWFLWRFSFGPFSIIVFLFFISLVAFAGTKIQQRGRELMIGEVKTGFIFGMLDFFFLPVIEVGRWSSRQLVRYNAIIFIFNFLIETPIQVFVEFFEQWRTFLKEKKEEIH